MRQERTVQATIFEVFAQHEIGCELKAMSQWLDGQGGLIGLVADDLRRQGARQTGRRGLPAESVLRCALLKQQRQLSYEELAFHLEDSASFRAFARLPWHGRRRSRCWTRRQVQGGHKLNLATNKCGLILDVVVEGGNPADAESFLPMLDRHIAGAGAPPRQTAADAGYASRANLTKVRGVA